MSPFCSMPTSHRQSHRPLPVLVEKHVTDRGSSDQMIAPLPSSLGTTFPEFLTAVSTPRTDRFNLPPYNRHTPSSTTALSSLSRAPCSFECLISDFPCMEASRVSGCSSQPTSGSASASASSAVRNHNHTSSNPPAGGMSPFATATATASVAATVTGTGAVSVSHHWPNKSISSSSEGSSATNTTNPSPTTSVSTAPFDSPTANQSPCSVSDGSFFTQQQESGPSTSSTKLVQPWSGLRDESSDGTVKLMPSLILPLSPETFGDCTTQKQGERMAQGDTSSQSLQPSGWLLHKMPASSANGQQRQRQQSTSSACSGILATSSPAHTPAVSPSRKPRRNIKKLTINTPGDSEETSCLAFPTALRTGDSAAYDNTAASRVSSLRLPTLPLRRVSAPASPSALQMQTLPPNEGKEESSQHLGAGARRSRRRPTNLTIQTPRWDSSFVAVPAGGAAGKDVPPTPNQNRDTSNDWDQNSKPRKHLHHYKSSPSVLPSPRRREPLTSTAVAERPEEEMMAEQRDGQNKDSGAYDTGACSQTHDSAKSKTIFLEKPRDGLDDTYRSPPSTRESHQEAPRGYPNGPICIYDEGLYLYLEPEVEDISSFDVVVNVAEEVRNPYKRAIAEGKPFDKDVAATQEYVHVPWSHSSEILQDLYPLCQFIDSRLSQSKRVLIHCQLGVSRSASLVIAYGLYKNPNKDFNEMYKIVKERSEWVGPNLGLIYQLMDFRGQITRGNHKTHTELPQSWFEKLEEENDNDKIVPSSQALNVEKPTDITEPQRRTESVSPPFIKTTFFANDESELDEVCDPQSILSPSSSPPPPTSFADLTLRLRRSSHTSKPLPLREMFEKPTVGNNLLPDSKPNVSAPPPGRLRFSQVPPSLSVDRPITTGNEMEMPAIGQVLKQGQCSPLAPSVDFGTATSKPVTDECDISETEVARATTILASPRTREFSRSQGLPTTINKVRRASLKLAALPVAAPLDPGSSAAAAAAAAGVQGTPDSAEMVLPFEDPRSPPPRSPPKTRLLREGNARSRPDISVGIQQRMEELQTLSPQVKPMASMENIREFL